MFYLVTGITLGLSSGLSPGPLFALVISETMNYGRKEGIKVALSPLITDIPIIILSYFVIDFFVKSDILYGILSLSGGIFIVYLAYGSLKMKEIDVARHVRSRSLQKGIVANFLNPAPYIFWIMVGLPTILNGFKLGLIYALLFVIPFYICLVGSKILLAILISRTGRVNSRVLRYINIGLGTVLLALAVKFIYDGIGFLT